jgi:hypothetical protein
MNPYIRYFAIIGAALLLGIGIFFAEQKMKPDNSKVFMGVGGDPRMRLCDSPANGELAQPDVLAKLGIATPLVKSEADKAAYRISILRRLGQESLSVTFVTPKSGAGKVSVARWSGGALTQATADLSIPKAATLVYAFKDAKIWDGVKPTMETLARAGEASAVIEVQAPNVSRCVTTRYDDERVRPLLAAFVDEIGPSVAPLSIDAMQAPKASFIPAAGAKTGGQGR